MNARDLRWQGLPVPYIAPWSHEHALPGQIVRRRGIGGEGIGYADEYSRVDRRSGVLWVRQAIAPGIGSPQLAGVHSLRQRQAADHMLCQVCGRPTFGRPDERHLYVVRSDGRPIQEGEKTTAPPVHEACARRAVQHCPHLRKGYTAALVGYSPYWGVAGVVYDPQTLQPLPGDDLELVGYEDPRIRWTLAAQSAVALYECETVNLDELALTGVAR
ncbi:hypothetical protein [Streptomyces lavendulocolor]|uniref:hypothetical protein n=1 Tax=Streptomyces lavendulocolor TaxID=67316 RepID=UPI0031DE64E4